MTLIMRWDRKLAERAPVSAAASVTGLEVALHAQAALRGLPEPPLRTARAAQGQGFSRHRHRRTEAASTRSPLSLSLSPFSPAPPAGSLRSGPRLGTFRGSARSLSLHALLLKPSHHKGCAAQTFSLGGRPSVTCRRLRGPGDCASL